MSNNYTAFNDYAPYNTTGTNNDSNLLCFGNLKNGNLTGINNGRDVVTKQPINIYLNTTPSAPVPAPSPPISSPAPWIPINPPSNQSSSINGNLSVPSSPYQLPVAPVCQTTPNPDTKYRYSSRLNNLTFPDNANTYCFATDSNHCENICLVNNDCIKWSYLPDASNNNCQLTYGQPSKIVPVNGIISGQIYNSK